MKVSTMRDGGRGKIELSQLYEHVPKVQLAIAVAMEVRSVFESFRATDRDPSQNIAHFGPGVHDTKREEAILHINVRINIYPYF